MRIIVRGEHITEPVQIVMDLDSLPRKGDYINLGDGIRRYVDAVVWDFKPRKWSAQRQRWEPEHPRREPWTVYLEMRVGIAGEGRA